MSVEQVVEQTGVVPGNVEQLGNQMPGAGNQSSVQMPGAGDQSSVQMPGAGDQSSVQMLGAGDQSSVQISEAGNQSSNQIASAGEHSMIQASGVVTGSGVLDQPGLSGNPDASTSDPVQLDTGIKQMNTSATPGAGGESMTGVKSRMHCKTLDLGLPYEKCS